MPRPADLLLPVIQLEIAGMNLGDWLIMSILIFALVSLLVQVLGPQRPPAHADVMDEDIEKHW